jgi:hypothetical protein
MLGRRFGNILEEFKFAIYGDGIEDIGELVL